MPESQITLLFVCVLVALTLAIAATVHTLQTWLNRYQREGRWAMRHWIHAGEPTRQTALATALQASGWSPLQAQDAPVFSRDGLRWTLVELPAQQQVDADLLQSLLRQLDRGAAQAYLIVAPAGMRTEARRALPHPQIKLLDANGLWRLFGASLPVGERAAAQRRLAWGRVVDTAVPAVVALVLWAAGAMLFDALRAAKAAAQTRLASLDAAADLREAARSRVPTDTEAHSLPYYFASAPAAPASFIGADGDGSRDADPQPSELQALGSGTAQGSAPVTFMHAEERSKPAEVQGAVASAPTGASMQIPTSQPAAARLPSSEVPPPTRCTDALASATFGFESRTAGPACSPSD